MRTSRPILFASLAMLFAACSDGVVAPDAAAPDGARVPSPFFSTSTGTTEPDSVIAGYGCESTGGIEYDPATGTEYCVTPDTTTTPPPPAPAPAPAPSPAPAPAPAPEDSVIGGYGSGSTGGIEYGPFEYDPETGTEYVPTTDPHDGDS